MRKIMEPIDAMRIPEAIAKKLALFVLALASTVCAGWFAFSLCEIPDDLPGLFNVFDWLQALCGFIIGPVFVFVTARALRRRETLLIGKNCFQILDRQDRIVAQVPYHNIERLLRGYHLNADIREPLAECFDWSATSKTIRISLDHYNDAETFWYDVDLRANGLEITLFTAHYSKSSRIIYEELHRHYYAAMGLHSPVDAPTW
jgi:hypothetical protein